MGAMEWSTAAAKMNSQNHVMMLGDLIVWYYENLAGIKAERPGFKRLLMKPEIINGLNAVDASYRSAYGLIKSSYTRNADKFEWKLSVPANTSAIVYIPATKKSDVTETLASAKDLKFLKMEKDRAVFELGSGDYSFVSEKN